MIVAVPILCAIALAKVGGISTILSAIESKGIYFTTSNPASSGKSIANFIIFAMPGFFPLMIQRLLMAKDTKQLKQSLVLNAVLATPFRIAIIILGICAFLLIPNINPELSLLELANYLIPDGFKGLALVALLAILMSTIDAALHLGAVAFTQDILGSVLQKPLDDAKKLKIARYASVFITIGSIFIVLYLPNIEMIFYLLMALGNTVMWPGLFWGLTGLPCSKRGFWLGIITSLVTVCICVFIFDVFLLYANLIGITVNLFSYVLFVYFAEKNNAFKLPLFNKLNTSIIRIKTLDNIKNARFVKNQEYCNMFCIFSIPLAIYPFFVISNADFQILLIFNSIIGAVAILLLFAELWNQKLAQTYPFLWAFMVALALPTQTYYMVLNTNASLIWLIDAIVIIPLLLTLTTKIAAVLLHAMGFLLAIGATMLVGTSYSQISPDFGYWAVLMHVLVLALCLALFRKRDVEMCRFTTATLIHETKRALSTFESAANYYDKRLPEIVSQYRKFSSDSAIPAADLTTMVELPNEVKKLSQRTRNLLTKFYNQISSYSGNRTFAEVNIKDCILTAMSDSSLDTDLRKHIYFDQNTGMVIKGDQDQLIQVLINLLENAGHALSSTKTPRIDIAVIGQTVFITDNGKGINSADLPNIFDELFSTKSSSGQGLAFCKRAMIEHGGNILCTSKKNEFTRFELRFPAKHEWSLT